MGDTSPEASTPADTQDTQTSATDSGNARSGRRADAAPAIGSSGPIPPPPVAKPSGGDTRPAAGGAGGDASGGKEPGSGRRRRRRRGGRGGGGQGEQGKQGKQGSGRQSQGRGKQGRQRNEPVEAITDDGPLELDEATLKTRRGRERRGKPLGRYLMCVSVGEGGTQIAVLEGRNLIEHYLSRPADDVSEIHGNVYLSKVQNVLPGMEAAFVDIGTPKNAVLYRGDLQFDPAQAAV